MHPTSIRDVFELAQLRRFPGASHLNAWDGFRQYPEPALSVSMIWQFPGLPIAGERIKCWDWHHHRWNHERQRVGYEGRRKVVERVAQYIRTGVKSKSYALVSVCEEADRGPGNWIANVNLDDLYPIVGYDCEPNPMYTRLRSDPPLFGLDWYYVLGPRVSSDILFVRETA